MKKVVQQEGIGEIAYTENFWTGRKSLQVNGQDLKKIDKKTFAEENGSTVTVQGNYLTGVRLQFNSCEVRVTPKIKWYEIVLSILPFILIMVWGNVVSLCEIVPVVGGAIGGAISGLMCVVNLFLIRSVKNIGLKIGISILTLGATFGICCGIGYAILSSL